MDENPDIYTDVVTLAATNFGLTLVLLRSQMSAEGGTGTNVVVGTVRMSHQLGKALAELLTNAVAQAEAGIGPSTTTIKH
jgi:hypothetical protein